MKSRTKLSSKRADRQSWLSRPPACCGQLLAGLLSLWLFCLPGVHAQQLPGEGLEFASVEELESAFEQALSAHGDARGPSLFELGRALLAADVRDLDGNFAGDLVLARYLHKLPRDVRADLAPYVGELARSIPLYFSVCAQIGKTDAALDAALRAAALLLVIRFEADADYALRIQQEVAEPSRFALEGLTFTLRHSTLMAGAALDEALARRDDALLLIAFRIVRPAVLTQARLQRVAAVVSDPDRELQLRRRAVGALARTGARARGVLEELLAGLPGRAENPRLRADLTKALGALDQVGAAHGTESLESHSLWWALGGLGFAAISLGLAVFGKRGRALLLGGAALALAWFALIEPQQAVPQGAAPDPRMTWEAAAGRLADSALVYLRAGPRELGRPGFAYASCAADIELGLAFEDLAEVLGPGARLQASLLDESTVHLRVSEGLVVREAAFSCRLLGGEIFLTERLDRVPSTEPEPGAGGEDAAPAGSVDAPTIVAASSLLLVLLAVLMSLRMPPELRAKKKAKPKPAKPKLPGHATTKLGKAVETMGKMIDPKEVLNEEFMTQSGVHRSQTGRHLRPSGKHPSMGTLTGKHNRSSGRHPSFRVVTRRMDRLSGDASEGKPPSGPSARGRTGRFRVARDTSKRNPTGRFLSDGGTVRPIPFFETDTSDQDDEA